MKIRKIVTKTGEVTEELYRIVIKEYKGIRVKYKEFYYLDYSVSEETFKIDTNKKDFFYKKDQLDRNLKAKKSAYNIELGAASPEEIITFREKVQIAASTLSTILGFSKNTISNIENEGITSLSSGRYIKTVLHNKDLLLFYLKSCRSIEEDKQIELYKKIEQVKFL